MDIQFLLHQISHILKEANHWKPQYMEEAYLVSDMQDFLLFHKTKFVKISCWILWQITQHLDWQIFTGLNKVSYIFGTHCLLNFNV